MTKPTWKSTFSMQRLQPGLKALLSSSCESKFRCLNRTDTFSSSKFLSLLIFSSSRFLSLFPSEKGKEIEREEEGKEEEEEEEEVVVVECLSRRQKWMNEWRKREFPPPMPMVVKTEKTSASQVPWVLKKYSYGENGRDGGGGNRVVMIEEKRLKHREYFRAHRANGHLTLQLICVDDDEDGDDDENVKEDEALQVETDNVEQEYYETDETEEEEPDDHEIDQNDEKGDADPTVEEVPVMALVSSVPEFSPRSESDSGGVGGKCWTVSSTVGRRSNSDLFRMVITTMRPIHG